MRLSRSWERISGRGRFPSRAGARFVAEVSSNHHADLERCIAFVDRAAEIGCDAVKFQLFRVSELFAPEILRRSAEHRKRVDWQLPEDFIPELAARAHQREIAFSCTPFHLAAVEQLAPHVDFLKIASYELLWEPLLVACAATKLPVVLSTGMATLPETARAVSVLRDHGCSDLTLLHCVSGYPARAEEANLAAIEALRSLATPDSALSLEVGWSDHTVEPAVIARAIHRFGAQMIEFHLDLDGRGEEFAVGHCWTPERIAPVIREARVALLADGSGEKLPAARETEERLWRADPLDGLRPLREMRERFGA